MLTPRIIPVLLLHNNRLTKTINFQIQDSGIRHDVGDPVQQAKVYEAQLADELMLLDIRATVEGRGTAHLLEWTKRIAEEITIPLTVGGGIKTVGQAVELIRNGAERIIIGSSVYGSTLIQGLIAELGNQSVAMALDVKKWHVVSRNATRTHPVGVIPTAKALEASGAGEILLTNVDREGTMKGYDLDLVHEVSHSVGIPVVANGGAGKAQDMIDAIKAGASGVAAGSLFCFTDCSVIKVKAVFERMGEVVRR